MPDFPFGDEVLHRARDVFNGHVRINAVLVEEVDHVGRRRRSDASATSLMCAGRLFSVREG